jgi:hypothetical protein
MFNQVSKLATERRRYPDHYEQTWIAPPALDATDVGKIELRLEGELLLRHSSS